MRIVCESCGTKYSISDEKVRGKLFKIRCKKCSHVIVVRGAQEEMAAAEQAAAAAGYGELPREREAPVDDSMGYEWYYVVDGQQAGPIAADDVGHYLATGQLHADTYMWRDGMEDWIHLSEVPEFAQLVEESVGAAAAEAEPPAYDTSGAVESTHPAPKGPPVDRADADLAAHIYAGSGDEADYDSEDEATRVMGTDSSDEPEPSVGKSLFGSDEHTTPQRPATDGIFAGAAAERRDFASFDRRDDYYDDDMTSPAPLDSGGGGLFSGGGFSAAALDGADNGLSQSDMVGARSENSVLFSLDTLAGIETGTDQGNGSGLPTTEGSGLIDIKALAASQAVASPEVNTQSSDLAIITPAVMPIGHRQSHTLLYGLMAAGAVIIIGLVLAIVLVLTGRQETEAQPQAAGPATETPEATQVAVAEQPGAVEDAVAAGEDAGLDVPPAPPSEHVVAAIQAGTLLAAYIAPQKAPAVAQAIADRPTRVASRERSSRRESSRSSRDSERSSRRDSDESERETSRTSHSSRSERESSSASAESEDPVDRALGRIQRTSSREAEEQESDRESSRSSERESETRSDLPEQLTTSQVSRSIRRYQRRLAECRQQSDLPAGEVLRVDVQMTVQGNGRVGSARTSSSDPAAPCIVDVVRDMRFDQFSGEAMNFTYPFRVR